MNPSESSNKTGVGYLIVRVATALGAIPLTAATVTIRTHLSDGESEGEGRGETLQILTTDESGSTPRIGLPTPPRSDSMSPYGGLPFSTYNIDVEAQGFYPQSFSNVPVYDTITSIQPANLIPIAENGRPDRAIQGNGFFQETTNPNLQA